jgi:hypothetical protein
MNDVARRILLAAGVGVALAAGQLHPMWRAEWMIRDDHQLLAMIGPEGRLPWREVLPVFAHTTNGRPGSYHRYQPVTQLLILAEAAVVGPHPRAWHVSLTVMFAFILAACFWVSSAFVGAGLATLVTAYVSTQWYWHDIFLHLFDGEKWSAVWLAVFCVAALHVWRRRQSSVASPTVALTSMAVSGALAAGSKENMLVLLPFYVAVLWWSRSRARIRWVTWAASLAYVLAVAVVVIAVFVGVKRGNGADEYGNPTDLRARLGVLAMPLPLTLLAASLLLVALRSWALHLGRRYLDQARNAEWQAHWRTVLIVAAGIVVVMISQFVFYNGHWPTQGGRWDFPGRLIEPALYVGAFHVFTRVASIWKSEWRVRHIGAAVLGVLLLALTARHASDLLGAARAQAAQSHREGDVRRAAAATVANTPARPIVMLASHASDEEGAYSLARMLRLVEGLSNPLFLDTRAVHADTASAFATGSVRQIDQLSRDGGAGFEGRLQAPILPWAELTVRLAQGAPRPLCVSLRGYLATEITECPEFAAAPSHP